MPARGLGSQPGGKVVGPQQTRWGHPADCYGQHHPRLAAKAACATLKTEIAAAVGSFQYGVGKSAGCELVHKLVTTLTDEDPSRVVISYDARNAFGTLPRQRIWDATLQRFPVLASTLHAWLSKPTAHAYWHEGEAYEVLASGGVDQGCPLSPLLFALGIAPALEAIRSGIRLLHHSCKVFAYLDDVVVVAPSHLAAAVHDVVSRAMSDVGLALNNGKTKAWVRNPAVPLPDGLPFNRVGSLKVLGSQVAWLDREDSLAPVHEAADPSPILQKARRLTDRVGKLLAHGLSARSAFLILQTFSKSCANHLLRANLETGPWLSELENILHNCLGKILVAPGSNPEHVGPEQAQIASLRTKDGGLAFGGLKHTSPFAFIGSWFLCLK